MSNGRDARSGSSLRVDIARIAANAPMFRAMIAASVPPATTTSARPERIMSMPYPMDSAPDAHALTSACAPALAPNSMLIQPAAPFGISIGTVYGEMRFQPRSRSVSYAVSVEPMPPMPLVTATPSRYGSTVGRARVGPGLAGRDERELLAAVHPARLHPADDRHRVRPRRAPRS